MPPSAKAILRIFTAITKTAATGYKATVKTGSMAGRTNIIVPAVAGLGVGALAGSWITRTMYEKAAEEALKAALTGENPITAAARGASSEAIMGVLGQDENILRISKALGADKELKKLANAGIEKAASLLDPTTLQQRLADHNARKQKDEDEKKKREEQGSLQLAAKNRKKKRNQGLTDINSIMMGN